MLIALACLSASVSGSHPLTSFTIPGFFHLAVRTVLGGLAEYSRESPYAGQAVTSTVPAPAA